jgi:hypothetical protein
MKEQMMRIEHWESLKEASSEQDAKVEAKRASIDGGPQ